MYDNKVRLSPDVLEKAELIAKEWGLKNARAAIEAVFRKYSDAYLQGNSNVWQQPTHFPVMPPQPVGPMPQPGNQPANCEALDELDALLGF
jgi:hypothetical protein